MSLGHRAWFWTCDHCGRENVPPPDEQPEDRGDVLVPVGWIHTMMGDDLCERCHQ